MLPRVPEDEYFELTPIKDSRKSFYHKAMIHRWSLETDPTQQITALYSYETLICVIYDSNSDKPNFNLNKDIPFDKIFSKTTTRHLKEFLVQFIGQEFTTDELKKIYLNLK